MKASIATVPLMKAVIQNGFGAPEQVLSVREVPRPVPASDEVLVRVISAAVNTPDWVSTMGVPYVLRLAFSSKNRIIGTDVSGVVEAVGSKVNSDFKPGDHVFGSTDGTSSGAFAEYALAKATMLAKKPDTVSFDEAAGSVMSGVTALQTLRDGAKLKPGMSILINGASGAVGTFAVQMAKNKGATVTGVCSARNAELVKSLGADHVVDYTKEDYTASDAKYDVILDNVMNKPFRESRKALKKDGFIIPNSVGVDRGKWFGAIPSFVFKPRNYPAIDCKSTRENLEEVSKLVSSGDVQVVIDKTFELDGAASAVTLKGSHRARGQFIVRVARFERD